MCSKLWQYFLLLGICLKTFLTGEEPAYILLPEQTHIPILTPSLAKRQTLKVRLANGLEAYLIEDPEAIQAGAVLTVQAGSWNDPDQYPGLAHFLEHMLFLGTEKYPLESDYDHFIRTHNGKSNAYTTTDYTLYLFSVSSSAFEEALDRFSYFFKKPLFNPSGLDRELNAVDQEFAKNFNQDSIREHHVIKALANAQHPFHRFNAGNSTTLAKASREILIDWYKEYYSAHHMRLIVYGPQPLETLIKWVVEDFKDIPSSINQPPPYPEVSALSKETEGKIIYIESLKNIRTLHLKWELPASNFFLPNSCRPSNIISFILGHEGKGSLSAKLKEEGLAESLSCYNYRLSKQHLLFSLSINLTEEGLKNISQVAQYCFQAIQNLQQNDLPSYLFEELKRIHTIRYQYQPRENTFDFLMDLGSLLVYEDLSFFPESCLIPQAFEQNLIHQFLDYLTPQRTHLSVLARFPSLQFDQTEQWMGVRYKIASFEIQQTRLELPSSCFHFPAPNPFIPYKLELISIPNSSPAQQENLPIPNLLINNKEAKIYFALDDRFKVPQTFWSFEIKTPAVEINNPKKAVLIDLYVKSLEETLQSYCYSAQLADLSYEISRTTNGIRISLFGYRDNAEKLFEIILKQLKNCAPTEYLFSIFKDLLLRKYSNFNQESSLKQGMEIYRSIIFESYSTIQERAKALEEISYSTFLDYLSHLYDQTYVEGLLYGNLNKDEAIRIWKKLQTTLSSRFFPVEQRCIERILVLPNQVGPYAINQHIQSSSHAAILGIEDHPFSFKKRAAQQILAQAINSAFYSTLRTKQQTGYLLFSQAEEFDKHLFFFFGVQSATHDPRDLLARFELFIEDFLQEMGKNELTEEHFKQIRQSLLNNLEHIPQNLLEAGQLLNLLAFKYEGDFEWMSKRIQGLKNLTYEEFLVIAKNFLGKQNKQRLAVLINGVANQNFHYHSLPNLQDIRKISYYTRE